MRCGNAGQYYVLQRSPLLQQSPQCLVTMTEEKLQMGVTFFICYTNAENVDQAWVR